MDSTRSNKKTIKRIFGIDKTRNEKMKRFSLIIFLLLGVFVISEKASAVTFYQCNTYYASPYTSVWSKWTYYKPVGAQIGHYIMNDCFTAGSVYGDMYLGDIGNSINIGGHILGTDCNDGTCDNTQTDGFANGYNTLTQGDKIFIAVYDPSPNVYVWRDFFTGASESGDYVLEAPSTKWSVNYYWYGVGGYYFDDSTNFGSSDMGFIADTFNSMLETIASKAPFSYFFGVKDIFDSQQISTESYAISFDFTGAGLGDSFSIDTHEDSFIQGFLDKVQPLFDVFVWVMFGVYCIFRTRSIFQANL
jgi:hypothetical protein